jgi:hypothetical protein
MTAHLLKRGPLNTSYTHIHDRSSFKRGKIDTPYTHIHDRSPFKRDKNRYHLHTYTWPLIFKKRQNRYHLHTYTWPLIFKKRQNRYPDTHIHGRFRQCGMFCFSFYRLTVGLNFIQYIKPVYDFNYFHVIVLWFADLHLPLKYQNQCKLFIKCQKYVSRFNEDTQKNASN